MGRGLRAPLSPNEEVALRRIAIGVAQPLGPEIERLKQLGLVEGAGEALCLSEAGRQRYARWAGIEGTISQSVRSFGARRTRYRGLPKTHLQQVVTAVAINVRRIIAWFDEVPKATTRTSHFAALAA